VQTGIQSVKSGDGIGGMGYEKKQMPLCNVKDKAESEEDLNDLTRKSAHFSVVITKETFAEVS
jgi:hypothetical protein